jgi:hypothetical protein
LKKRASQFAQKTAHASKIAPKIFKNPIDFLPKKKVFFFAKPIPRAFFGVIDRARQGVQRDFIAPSLYNRDVQPRLI